MKIAVLLLAHKNKSQLERLLSVMKHKNVDIFIHLDKKAAFQPSDITAENVIFTEKRYDVGLFEFSMVEAERELIQTARLHGNYSYFILMSGQCYPLVSIEKIVDHLTNSYPEPYIEIVAPKKDNYVRVNFAHVYILKRLKLRTYAFLKKHFTYDGYRILRYIPGGFVFLISRLKELFVKPPKTRLERMGLPMYCGSQWWILPDTVINRVVPFFENKEYCKIVYDTFSCDETFFQTAIMAEPEANGIKPDDNGNYMNRKWFYIFWEGHPILLRPEHHKDIHSSGMFFARKFDTAVDTEILNLIDNDRMKKGGC